MKRFIEKNKNIFKWVLGLFFFWRVSLILIAALGLKIVPLREGYLGGGTMAYLSNPLLWAWANFDGVHYLTIAQHGYYQFQQAFFPFYPYFIRYLNTFFKDYLFSGLFISHLSLIVFLFLFYKLVKLDFDEGVAKKSLIYLLLFPTSFYLGSVYTESLFLALVLGSFYAARKKKWGIAGLLGACASATRLVGIFLFPALLFEWSLEKKKKGRNLLPLSLIGAGLLLYMFYLKKTLGDPLYFIHVQPFFGAERTGGKIVLLYQVFWRYLRMLITVQKTSITYFVVVLEAFTGVAFLLMTIFTYLRRWFSYFIFMVLAYITPTLTGTFSSMPRYALALFPGFILLAIWAEKYRWVGIFYPLISTFLLILSVIFFTRGFFIA